MKNRPNEGGSSYHFDLGEIDAQSLCNALAIGRIRLEEVLQLTLHYIIANPAIAPAILLMSSAFCSSLIKRNSAPA